MPTTAFLGSLPLVLEHSPIARSKAVSKYDITAGQVVAADSALVTVLFEREKGHRCDICLVSREKLQRCSGCASYWYCDANCQKAHWPFHKKLCKKWNSFAASPSYQALHAHERLDSVLLSHLNAVINDQPSHLATSLAIFKDLLPGPAPPPPPPACVPSTKEDIHVIYSRFGNNNFTIHSHLVSFAHGIFPLASRLFNHSCVPNAAARFKLMSGQSVTMEVVALRNIVAGEEVSIPYLDPALLQTRQQVLQLTYGFHCNCSTCQWYNSIDHLSDVPEDPSQLAALEQELRSFIGIDSPEDYTGDTPNRQLPSQLLCFMKEDYLERSSSIFSRASHEGPYDLALSSGSTLLALYLLIYPPHYPQIGMHALELAKTAWNASLSTPEDEPTNVARARKFLSFSRRILEIYGREGDDGGPLDEIATLKKLLG